MASVRAQSRCPLLTLFVVPLLVSGFLLCGGTLTVGYAQIVRDGSVGPPGGPLTGSNYVIGHDLGQIRGSNLFHRFSQFNLQTIGATIESATFSGPSSIANIVSRVTAGQSSINGRIDSSAMPNATLTEAAFLGHWESE